MTDPLAVPLHYFTMAMQMDKQLCLPRVLCETAANSFTPVSDKDVSTLHKPARGDGKLEGTRFQQDIVQLADVL